MKNLKIIMLILITSSVGKSIQLIGQSIGEVARLQKQLFDVIGATGQDHVSQKKSVEQIANILSQGISPLVTNNQGETALIAAVKAHSFTLVYLLLNYQFSYGYSSNVSGNVQANNNKNLVTNASQIMTESMKINIINITKMNKQSMNKTLLNAQDNKGMTALMYAACFGYQPIVKLLLAAGASKNIKNKEGKTAAQLAEDNNIAMLDILNGRDIVHNNQGIENIGTSGVPTLDSSHGFPQVSHAAVPMISQS